jgi:hypothetical protein
MKLKLAFATMFIVSVLSTAAYSSDSCKDVLADGTMKSTTIKSSTFFSQLLAADLAQKSDHETDEKLEHDGTMGWAGITMGGKFTKQDVKRYIDELRTKFDISTVMRNETSTLLASGDPVIVKAWKDCMQDKHGLAMWFEAKSPTSAILQILWYAPPTPTGVSTDTKLKEDIKIPQDITVEYGQDCLKASKPLHDKVPCSVKLLFKSGARDLLLVANSTLATADAYLPPRQVLVPERESWKPQPGEQPTVQVYAVKDDTRSKSSCLSPKKDWAFVEATVNVDPTYLTGKSDPKRCTAEITKLLPSYICFNARMAPTAEGDNRCNATLSADIIHWKLVDGLGVEKGLAVGVK